MKAVLVPWLAGVLWVGTLAVSVPGVGHAWEQAPLPVVGDPWFSTPGTCDCDPCRSGALWGGYCAERAAYYAHRRHFWQKVHCAITLGWLPKPHAGYDRCCPQIAPAEVLPEGERPPAELQQPAESSPALPPPPLREARQLRLPLRAAVAAQARQPVLRGHRGSWVRASLAEGTEARQFRLPWPRLPWPTWLARPQAN